MKISTVPVCNNKRSRQGMTLVEVMLAAVILGILAVVASNSLFYPRWLVVNSGLEQSAIHAATAELERHLHSIDSTPLGQFNTDGWPLQNVTTNVTQLHDDGVDFGGAIGDRADYLEIKTTVEYRDGKTVELITYRSLKVPSDQR